ncbi:MAG: hypothetical protein BGO14_05455 [Chlamydiales bacterium 38-26]|nr:hypothetical protein [Chlamydiales bacterium]OJV07920.1 MAG: hypothetical protein BGO14_05455 [Chlamydiales bacterium 38-26]
MIKLIIDPHTSHQVRTFDQEIVTIGSGTLSPQADLLLHDPELKPIHVKIIKKGDRFTLVNFAQDPFATLNDLPFGKRTIQSKDVIKIGQHTLVFEISSTADNPSENQNEDFHIQNTPLKPAVYEVSGYDDPLFHDPSPALPIEKPIAENLQAQDTMVIDEDLAKDVESNQNTHMEIEDSSLKTSPNFAKSPPSLSSTPLSKSPSSFNLKKTPIEFQVGEFDDESENWTTDKNDISLTESSEVSHLINWKLIGTIIISFLFVLSLVAGALYFNMSARNEDEELRAAEGVADVAMALKYAQVHHIKPHKKNWSDPEFIKTSLAQVIPHDYPSLTKINHHGHLNNTAYSLRVYTSTDFSQFLVIAQPAPSLLQWLIPKTAIVIDSKLMQLRKVADMKTLNRLLVNSNNLDNSNAVEVTNLVKNGELIPLETLAQKRKSQDFSPPRALTLLRPGAENYIYNAPRYYQLGETIIRRAISLMETPGSAYELSRLKQEMSLLSKMSDMVLYSSDGIELTLEAQKAVATFVSNASFLTAYLKFNPDGLIVSSHLIIDDEGSHHALTDTSTKPIVPVENYGEEVAQAEPQENVLVPEAPVHPLLAKLVELKKQREKTLAPIKNQIIAALDLDLNHPAETLYREISALIDQHKALHHKLKKEIQASIHQLSDDYKLMPLEEFIDYLDKAGLSDIKLGENHDQKEKVDQALQRISTSVNFVDLDHSFVEISRVLTIKNSSNLKELLSHQKMIRSAVIAHLNKLLLSSHPIAIEDKANQQHALKHLLKLCCMDSPEEEQYYINEFNTHFFNH